MKKRDHDPLSNGLLYQAILPLRWEGASDGVTEQQLVAAEDHNERMLQALITLQERHLESQEEEQENAPELARIEAKLDMLMELVSQLKPQREQEEGRFSLKLGSRGISWQGCLSPLPQKDQSLWLYLQLDERLPKPLQLFGYVVTVEDVVGGHSITLVFEDLGQRVMDLLGKLIFRQHRREVALKRSRP
ncbi:MAG: PilZ domain-containing protein [Candidatus Sedimenticola sp. (ex Thyasira tokunagai)]